MGITFKNTKFFDSEQLENLFRSVGWKYEKKSSQLKEALLGSEVVISAWDNDVLTGITNALTDCGSVVYVHYFLVHNDYQGKGIGKEMMQQLMAEFQSFRHIVLIANNDKTGFFEKCGFFVGKKATVMEIRRNMK